MNNEDTQAGLATAEEVMQNSDLYWTLIEEASHRKRRE